MRYLSAEAARSGVQLGSRYATVLGVFPDLLAGTSSAEDLVQADAEILELLRGFSPNLRRRSNHLQNGLYLLDASGLERAFKSMSDWAQQLLGALTRAGWEGRLAVGFTPFATEMATYHLSKERPLHLFRSRREEERRTLETPLSSFSLAPDQVSRLRRFQILNLGDFLSLEVEEVKQRFGGDLLEFYEKASGAIFAVFPPLPEPEPMVANMGFHQPVSELAPLLESARRLLAELLPTLLAREEAIATVFLKFLTEDDNCHDQVLRPTYPTADLNWLMKLIELRLERYFQKHPLRWGSRVERLIVEVVGEVDPEKQGELFSDWALDVTPEGEERLAPRDRQAGLWALSQVRAEFGDQSLVRAHLLDHHLPDRDHVWRSERESAEWLGRLGRDKSQSSASSDVIEGKQDLRVRRILYQPVALSRRSDWGARYGPYSVNGGWWGESYAREYCFAQKKDQTAWLYEDLQEQKWRVQGWLQ